MFKGAVCGVNTIVHDGGGLNMTLNLFLESLPGNHGCPLCSADIDNVSYRWCPGIDHVIFEDMVFVPLRPSTALQSAFLAFCACFYPKATGFS